MINGSMVQWLRHFPVTEKTGVQFPLDPRSNNIHKKETYAT